MPSKKLSRYEKILAREDGKRPTLFKDLATEFPGIENCMVLRAKLLFKSGGTLEISWSEREADKMTASEKAKARK